MKELKTGRMEFLQRRRVSEWQEGRGRDAREGVDDLPERAEDLKGFDGSKDSDEADDLELALERDSQPARQSTSKVGNILRDGQTGDAHDDDLRDVRVRNAAGARECRYQEVEDPPAVHPERFPERKEEEDELEGVEHCEEDIKLLEDAKHVCPVLRQEFCRQDVDHEVCEDDSGHQTLRLLGLENIAQDQLQPHDLGEVRVGPPLHVDSDLTSLP